MADRAEPMTTPPPQDAEFDPLEFWIRYKSKILLVGGVILVALIVVGAYQAITTHIRKAAEAAFATASTPEQYKRVADDYPHTIPGQNALLEMAASLQREGKWDDAAKILRDFVKDHPEHPLVSGAYASLGASLEASGKKDEALAIYQKVTTSFPSSYAAPAAWFGQARVLAAQGKSEEARRAYETVLTQFVSSPYAQQAQMLKDKLK